MRVPITDGGLESRHDAALCALIASCTRRRRRYVQRRETTYRTRSRGPIGHRNDQSSFDILSPCLVHVCAKRPCRATQHRPARTRARTRAAVCTHVMSRPTHRAWPATTTTAITTTEDAGDREHGLTPGSEQRRAQRASVAGRVQVY